MNNIRAPLVCEFSVPQKCNTYFEWHEMNNKPFTKLWATIETRMIALF